MSIQTPLVLAICLLVGWSSFAQSEVFNITDHSNYATCDAIMHDSNGGLVPYSPSSNNTITLCPPAGETQVNLYFIGFNLSTGDNLSVYDGQDMAAPLIGNYSGEDLLFETISPTNPTGCLTVHFESNADDQTGDFSIRISCGTPCDYPVAIMDAAADTLRICPGEQFTIDASASFWTEGVDLASWTWDLGNNTTDEVSWPTLTHAYDTPGGYRVRLYLTDANDCSSANIPEIVVLVSTPYTFDVGTSNDIFCIGETVYIGSDAYLSNTQGGFTNESQNGNTNNWTENNNVVFDNGVYIPDNQGCLYTEITFNQFGTATIDEAEDFQSILINMEHSFVGDIIINIICPTGEVLSLWPEAGGSGTYLGEPIDIDDGVPGVGFDYTWSPNSTGGTWLDGMNGFGGTVPAGDYEPEGDWSDLFGCPLNGTWQLEICDVVGADDGWVFEFGIQFAPEFYPALLTFTPTVGNGCDSSYWSNQSQLESIGSNCDWATFIPTEGGVYTFTYTVVNDFGCTYQSDVTITAIEPPVVDAGDDFIFCGNPLQIDATLVNGIANVPYTYQWSPAGNFANAGVVDPTLELTANDDDQEFIITVFPTQFNTCIGRDTVWAIVPDVPPAAIQEAVVFCIGEQSAIDVSFEDGDYIYSLFFPEVAPEDLITSNSLGTFFVGDSGMHFITVTEPQCGFTSVMSFMAMDEVCEIKIPNVFTPNSDGKNEAFVIDGVENYPGSTLQIYDRWGNMIYESASYNNSWTGRDQAEGTYYYIFGHNQDSGMEYYEGHFTLLRK
jgi:gliding motility-associated-like protein